MQTADGIPTLTRVRQGAGDPLVLLHGLGLSWRSWKPVLPALAREHDVVALDLPGFGAAPAPHHPPTIAALADAVEAELDRAGLDRVGGSDWRRASLARGHDRRRETPNGRPGAAGPAAAEDVAPPQARGVVSDGAPHRPLPEAIKRFAGRPVG